MRLMDLQNNLRRLELEFAGGTLKFAYRPAEVTPAFHEGLGAERQPLVWALSKTVVEWDLLGEDDKPLPITERVLMELPTPFLRAVLRSILDDVNVGEAFGATSKIG